MNDWGIGTANRGADRIIQEGMSCAQEVAKWKSVCMDIENNGESCEMEGFCDSMML